MISVSLSPSFKVSIIWKISWRLCNKFQIKQKSK